MLITFSCQIWFSLCSANDDIYEISDLIEGFALMTEEGTPIIARTPAKTAVLASVHTLAQKHLKNLSANERYLC